MARQAVLRFLKPLAGLLSQNYLLHASGKNLALPFWHAVNDKPAAHYNKLFSVPGQKEFERTLDFLLRHFKALDLQEYRDVLLNGKGIRAPRMHLSFDDGLRECAEIIAPILQRKGLPASFFINPSFIGNADMFYRYKVSLLLNRMQQETVTSSLRKLVIDTLEEYKIRAKTVEDGLLRAGFESTELLNRVAELLGVSFQEYLREQRPYMDQEELRQLLRSGFTLGAHSLDHPWFPALDAESRLDQAVVSMERVSMEFGLDYMAFAFPFSDDHLPASLWTAMAQRLSVPFLTFGTSGLKDDPVPFSGQRIPMEVPGMKGEELIKGEYLYYLLKGLIGRNTLRRK